MDRWKLPVRRLKLLTETPSAVKRLYTQSCFASPPPVRLRQSNTFHYSRSLPCDCQRSQLFHLSEAMRNDLDLVLVASAFAVVLHLLHVLWVTESSSRRWAF